jgi:hypothetical protein
MMLSSQINCNNERPDPNELRIGLAMMLSSQINCNNERPDPNELR